MWLGLLFLMAAFVMAPLARNISRGRQDVLLAPALLATAWVLVVSLSVRIGATLSSIWLPVWLATFAAAGLGLWLTRGSVWISARSLALPAGMTCLVLAPYLLHGVATYPGSWFWDGFAYMAIGESLWSNPRGNPVPGLELFYEFGAASANGRFISGAMISLFKGIFPPGGDAQMATGYFLFFCVFTFACSCSYLATVALAKDRLAAAAFVVLATVSGPVINLLWANNFDHLLAMAIAPAALGLAMDLRWGDLRSVTALAILCAAEVYIYPEMAALLILPAALVLLFRLFERNDARAKSITVAVGFVVFGVIAPIVSEVVQFIQGQAAAAMTSAAGARPGNGYYPTLFTWACGPGAMIGLYPPFTACADASNNAFRFMAGAGALGLGVYALVCWRNSRALALNTVLLCGAFGYFLFAQRYDYGAFKILASNWTPALLLIVTAVASASTPIRVTAVALAGLTFGVAVAQVRAFDKSFPQRAIEPFAALAQAIPRGAVVNLRVSDPLRFEWATYYLRDHRIVVSAGQLAYYRNPDATIEPSLSRLANAQYIVTDHSLAGRGAPLWSNDVYYVYAREAETASRQ